MRTPVSCVLGSASLLSATNMDEEQLDLLHTIRVSSAQLLSLINNLLDIFKLEEEKIKLDFSPFSLLECAENSVGM